MLLGVGGLSGLAGPGGPIGAIARALMAIELEMANGRFGIAARELNKLLEQIAAAARRRFCWDGVNRNGADSRPPARLWPGSAPGSELSHKAILARMRLFHDQGQFAAAEQLINEAARDPRERQPARASAARADLQPARPRSMKRNGCSKRGGTNCNERGEGASERAIDQVRMHIELDFKPNPVAKVRAYLDQAYTLAPDDDRVWLGRANLAIRTGDLDEASAGSIACLKRRPDDVAGLVRLASPWHRVQPDRACESGPEQLAGRRSTQAQIHRLGAWLCARRGDAESERQELERCFRGRSGRSSSSGPARPIDQADRPAGPSG